MAGRHQTREDLESDFWDIGESKIPKAKKNQSRDR